MKSALSLLALVAAACAATMSPPVAANSSAGQYDANARAAHPTARCMSCEVRACVADDAPLRAESRATTHGRRSRCDAILDTGYFPAEEDHIAAYLAKQRYPFE